MCKVFNQVSEWFKATRERRLVKAKKVLQNEKGMTLIELLAVLVIIAIIAAIAIPTLGSILTRSRANADIASAEVLYRSVKMEMMLCNDEAGLVEGDMSSASICGTPASDLLDKAVKLNLVSDATLYIGVEEGGDIFISAEDESGDKLYPEASGVYANYSWE